MFLYVSTKGLTENFKFRNDDQYNGPPSFTITIMGPDYALTAYELTMT